MKQIIYTVLMLGLNAHVFGQDATGTGIEMADALRASGKIYVVVAVLAIIMAGIFIYLIGLDQKIRTFEKELKDSKK